MTTENWLNLFAGILLAIPTVGVFLLIAHVVKRKFTIKKDNILNPTVYDNSTYDFYRKMDCRLSVYNSESQKRKYKIEKWDARELISHVIDSIADKFYNMISEELKNRISYKENKDGELEATIDVELVRETLNDLATRNELIKEVYNPQWKP